MKRVLITFFCLCSLLTLQAQRKYAIEVNGETKIIRVDSLHLSPDISVAGLLKLLPELLERSGNTIVSNYDVQLEDLSLGNTTDAALSQLKINDIERIEVEESPISSYQHNGQGGAIKIYLRSKASTSRQEQAWGSASFNAYYPTDLMPQLLINFKNTRWLIRAVLLGEYFDGSSDEKTQTGTSITQSHTDQHFLNEMARIYLTHRASPKDLFNLKLSESYSRNHQVSESDNLKKNQNYQVFLSWDHAFTGFTKSTIELNYTNEPGLQEVNATNQDLYNLNRNHFFSEKWCLNHLYKNANGNSLETEVGINAFEYHNRKENNFQSTYSYNLGTLDQSIFLMPYLQVQAKLGDFKVKGIMEYQYYNYDLTRENTQTPESYEKSKKDVTAKLIFGWQMEPHKHLRLMLDRKLDRPQNSQLYPYTVFDPSTNSLVTGNPDLSTVLSHEIGLNYIADYAWKGQSLTVDAGVSYNLVDDIITSYYSKQTFPGEKLGLTFDYLTYMNSGKNRLWNANFMALYQKGVFTLSFTGNYSRNNKNIQGTKDHYAYYNLSLLPSVSLKNGWSGSLNLLYHSKVSTVTSDLGACSYGQFTIGKAWGPFYASFYGKVCFTGKTKDSTYRANAETTYRTYDLVTSSIGAGIRYQF